MSSCRDIYQGLYSEEQNFLMENIQWIVIIIGSFTFVLTMITDLIYDLSFDKAKYAVLEVIILFIVLIAIVKVLLNVLMYKSLKGKKTLANSKKKRR